MSATVAGNQQQQHPHQEWDINDSNVPRVSVHVYLFIYYLFLLIFFLLFMQLKLMIYRIIGKPLLKTARFRDNFITGLS